MTSGHEHLRERITAAAAAAAEAEGREALVDALAELQETLAELQTAASIGALELSLARARRRSGQNGQVQEPLAGLEQTQLVSQTAMAEALLFVAPEPLDAATLGKLLGLRAEATQALLDQLGDELAGRGIRLQRDAGRLQLISAPEAAPLIQRMLGIQTSAKLSAAALETLAVVAYRQPVTRAQIEAVRGVDSSAIVRALLARGLITEAGRAESIGRPILYTTTPDFLSQFGLQSLSDLPPLDLPEISV